jgi:Response regulator containing a CheY-like receiver domain and an HD-GYP domain
MSDERQLLLIVDDSPDEIALLEEILKTEYRVVSVTSGEEALKITHTGILPDLILLDIMMPDMDGYETCRRLRHDSRTGDIPIIFLTAKTGPINEKTGLDLGAEDYITKPPSPSIVRARIRTQLRLKQARDFLKNKAEYLEEEVARRIKDVALVQDVTMIALGSLAETRGNLTGNHIRRTQNYIRLLAEKLSMLNKYRDILSYDAIERLYKSAPLHDIGKVGIPDSILKKPGQLTGDEFELMKTHTTIGYSAISAAEKSLNSTISFLSFARDMAWAHHEKWDGTGYPRGISGTEIPLAGRLMAIPDVYDALISERVYKKAFSHEDSVAIIAKGIGSHFDPDIGKIFLEVQTQFQAISLAFRDR